MKYISILALALMPLIAGNLEITSDDFLYKDGENKAKFVGHVVANQGKNIINSDTLIVFLDNSNEAEKYKAIKNVYFEVVNEKKDINGTCNTMIYLPNEDKYILTGNVVINDRKNDRKVYGDKVTLDNKKGTSYAGSNGKKPIKFIFKVKSKK